jgi:outer membrane protein TolC
VSREDLKRARLNIDNAKINQTYAGNQKLPDVRLNANYSANALGGTQVLRTADFPGTIIGPGAISPFTTILGQLFSQDYPTWGVGVSVSYPLGQSTAQADSARAKLQTSQSEELLKSAEGHVIQELRDAGFKIEMNAKRIATTRAARELADQRLDAERKRFEVGMSTSFLVIQAQRDLAQAKNNEVGAVLAYDLSLVDFDALQEAGPSAASAASAAASGITPGSVAVQTTRQ